MSKQRISVGISQKAAALLDQAAALPGAQKSSIVEAAVLALLSPPSGERDFAIAVKRLDRLTRAVERLANDSAAQSETLALYILYYLCITPPLPEGAREAAEALGRKRFEYFIRQVADRLLGRERYADAVLAAMGGEVADRRAAPRRESAEPAP